MSVKCIHDCGEGLFTPDSVRCSAFDKDKPRSECNPHCCEFSSSEVDSLESLASEAKELLDAMGMNAQFSVNEEFEESTEVVTIYDCDGESPCVGDVVKALNLVVRLAALNRNGGAK